MNFDIELDGKKYRLAMRKEGGGHPFTLDGKPCDADVRLVQPNVLSLLIEGRSYRVLFDPRPGSESALVFDERRISYRIDDPRSLRSRSGAGGADTGARSITASMPGRVIRLLVRVGDEVEAHQGLIVIEAMKMQNELKAPKAGKITKITAEVGATVQAGSVLLIIE